MSKLKSASKISNLAQNKYNPSAIEEKWQKVWNQNGIYSPNLDTAKKPFYNLMMFPYPSADGMHVGNMYAFTGADVYGRFMRMQGNDVFEPIGLDGFGIHSENYAIKVGRHPKEQAKISEANFYRQLSATGNGFDWSRTLKTYDPKYYKWTQWLFIQLFKAGLAYRKKAPVNFCPSCKTVLADEQVVKGHSGRASLARMTNKNVLIDEIPVCERCETEVEKKELEQWFFRITKYADRLLRNIDKLNWSEKVKIAQRQWIGKSEGALVKFKIRGSDKEIEVFTTRPDTLFGATFLVLSPENSLVDKILKPFGLAQGGQVQDDKIKKQVEIYVQKTKKKTEQERMAERKEKTGVPTGLYAINPVNNEEIPIWIADYVLMGYGTGAIMAVPAHDERDFEFAKKYNLPIKQVIVYQESAGVATKPPQGWTTKKAYTGGGIIVNSNEWNGWKVPDEIGRVIDWLKEKDFGKREVTYHLRDWLISRQRYWGPPIPMIYCKGCAKKGKGYSSNVILGRSVATTPESRKGTDSGQARMTKEMFGWFPVLEKDLPVLLPDVKDWKPKGIHSTGSGQAVKSPLASVESFVNTKCPNCKSPAKRETDVSDTFLDSAWYFFRYTSTDIESKSFDIKRVKLWLPVKMYIGGAEHSVLHLLYSRFITMALYDLGFVDFEEPFSRFYAHGLLIKQGAKMSKSKGNVVIPDEYIKKYGADTLRCYLMFLGPFNQGGDFYDTGTEGMHRFVKRVWRLVSEVLRIKYKVLSKKDRAKDLDHLMHKTIKSVTEDMEKLRYNTAIAHLMEYYNELHSHYTQYSILNTKYCKTLVLLLAPFAPHIAEELFQLLRNSKLKTQNSPLRTAQLGFAGQAKLQSIHNQSWPTYDPKFLEEQEVTIVVQVDGRVRGTIRIQNSESRIQNYVEELARESERVRKYLEGKKIKKVVYVEGKIINFVTE